MAVHLAQLSKALHGVLSCQGHGPLVQALVGTCLQTTSGLVPHFTWGFPPLGAGPAYRSLVALAFFKDVLQPVTRTGCWQPWLSSRVSCTRPHC